jgi:Ca-activated chloride channel family protein
MSHLRTRSQGHQGRPGSVAPHRRRSGSLRGRWLWLAAITAVVSLLVVAVVLDATGSHPSGRCSGRPVTLTVAASAGQFPALDRLARTWSAGAPAVGGQCVAASAVRMEAADVAARLRPSWKGSPRPDVWVPESTLWLGIAASRPQARVMLPQTPPSIASSPVVMAVREPVARAKGWPARTLTWDDVLGAATRFGTEDPARSTAGLSTVVAVVDPNANGTVDDTELPVGLSFTRTVAAGTPVPARGPPSADVFPAIERDLALQDVPFVPVYQQRDAVVADYPYTVLSASWVDGVRRRTADTFLRYVLTPHGQDVLGSDGFREPGGSPARAPQLDPARGFRAIPPQPRELTTLATSQIMSEWTAMRRPANLLAVVDTSASMNFRVPGTTLPRIELARQIVLRGLARLPGGTNFGLWEFATRLTPDADYRELVPFGPVAEPARVGQVAAALSALRPAGDTALYDTVYAAFRAAQSRWRPDAINAVVVVTDGRAADDSGMDREQLIAALRREGRPDRPVTVVGVAVGSVAAAGSLRDITAVTGGGTYPVSDATMAVDTVTLAFAGRLY